MNMAWVSETSPEQLRARDTDVEGLKAASIRSRRWGFCQAREYVLLKLPIRMSHKADPERHDLRPIPAAHCEGDQVRRT
jgi:hypothetical protein